ncbi:MAG: class IV adenylate cyclase [Bacteroidales bacterium]|nr:class IV adenylate cyclase [Bacteroidales bacterium]
MAFINIEIKARCEHPEKVEKILADEQAEFKGTDHQVDTYFNVNNGRLKLREGNIENALIFYERQNKPGPKVSDVFICKLNSGTNLNEVLNKALGTKIVVDKTRKIFFIENIKFHIDHVKDLGSFVEIEAIDEYGTMGKEKLTEQCRRFIMKFGIQEHNLVSVSYCDLLMMKKSDVNHEI